MNTIHTAPYSIFRDQPITEIRAFSAALRAACQEPSDLPEVLLRAVLVVCTVTALLICGWVNTDVQNAPAHASQPLVANQTFSVNSQHVF